VYDILFQLRRELDGKPPVFGVGNLLESLKLANAVDMALNDVSVEASAGSHGQLEIDDCAGFQASEGRAPPGFRREIGVK